MSEQKISAEQQRLNDNAIREVPLEKWGPYLSDRQWGTVREDYSPNGDAWNYFPHDHARSRAYIWGEDGIGGISDYFQNLCFAPAFWNGRDPILKERLFGLNNQEGNHGEDVKELYYYLDNLPSHYYMKFLYKYPQQAFPYAELVKENASRSRLQSEYELLDTGIFDQDEYFDVLVEYAKKSSEDLFIRISITNRGLKEASLSLLPTIWCYNRWWDGAFKTKPSIKLTGPTSVEINHERLGQYFFYFPQADELLFTENETNRQRLFGEELTSPFVKDAFHEAVINNDFSIFKDHKQGTKFSPFYQLSIDAGGSRSLVMRLCSEDQAEPFSEDIDALFAQRVGEADEFYRERSPEVSDPALLMIQRQAYAGLLWSKQYYHYDVDQWKQKSDGITPVSEERMHGRNSGWRYLKNQDVILMPDKWEYPWYAAWDLAFHCIPMAHLDPAFAKNQLILIMREWYMDPSGQIPAYEWNFSDVNPPVHAWAAMQVYRIEKGEKEKGDIDFLKRVFQKLIINFTWWINRKDHNGNNIFEGGFLGLDNIGVFNRDLQLPGNEILEQADGTSWMGMYASSLMDIALEISKYDPAIQDSATKFYEHFVMIGEALNEMGLWNKEEGFFYDTLSVDGANPQQIKVRSVVGLTSLFAASLLDKSQAAKLTDFSKRIAWFKDYRIENGKFLVDEQSNQDEYTLVSLISKETLVSLLRYVLDEEEFLSPGGIRALSKYYLENPYSIKIGEETYSIQYDPAESTTSMYGGNSNWRGPVWVPFNYLIIRSLRTYYHFYGDSLLVECPRGSGNFKDLHQVTLEITNRMLSVFLPDENGDRAVNGRFKEFYRRPANRELVLFYEYFHGENGEGLGASHQTGWTALVAQLIHGI
ncbi:MAG: glucosidase [Chitinophagaceae bacterium]